MGDDFIGGGGGTIIGGGGGGAAGAADIITCGGEYPRVIIGGDCALCIPPLGTNSLEYRFGCIGSCSSSLSVDDESVLELATSVKTINEF